MRYLILISLIAVIGCGKKVKTTKTACTGYYNGKTCITTTTTDRVKKQEITPDYCDRYMHYGDNTYYNCLNGFNDAVQR